MKQNEILQFALFVLSLVLVTKPVGIYLHSVFDPRAKTFLDGLIQPLERFLYRAAGIDPCKEQDWKHYSMSLFCFSFVGALFTYVTLRLQRILPFNPQGLGPLSEHSGFNVAVSFVTNTNWQSYVGESDLSYFSQMVGLTFHNFMSAAVGISVAAAFVRGIARPPTKTIGNFWVDIIRVNLYLLIPISMVISVFLLSQGVIQNFRPYVAAQVVDFPSIDVHTANSTPGSEDQSKLNLPNENNLVSRQIISQGPVASQVAIKLLGTNGGGFMNANASHPFENPTPLSNFVQMLVILMIPSGLTYYLGRMVKNQWHGWSVWSAMLLLLVIGTMVCVWAESHGNPRMNQLGVDGHQGNMEGKETRFGTFNSCLFAVVTTAASCGAVNSMHDSFTPIGGLVPLLNIQMGGVIYGGVGSGLYGMLVFVVLAVFLAGLMIGRTPEYLGKKIHAYDVKMAVLFIIIPVISVLGFTALTVASEWGVKSISNHGPHGLTEILYACSSATGNNGIAFAGLKSNTPEYDLLLGMAMLIGRFLMIAPVMALAGNFAEKKRIPQGPGSFPVSGITFTVLLTATVFVVGALTFFPVLSLGPVLEQFIMMGGDHSF